MKEESKKVSFLVNRYGLLAVLGLGVSFLGTEVYAAAPVYPTIGTDKGGRVSVGDPNGVFPIDDKGALGTATAGGDVFTNKGGFVLQGKADDDALLQALFDAAKEGAGFKPDTAHSYQDIKVAFSAGGAINKRFIATENDSLGKILNKLAIERARAAIAGLDVATVRTGNVNGVSTNISTAVDEDEVKRILAEFKKVDFLTKEAVGLWLEAIKNATAPDMTAVGGVNVDFGNAGGADPDLAKTIDNQAKLIAVGTKLKAIFDASAFWAASAGGNGIVDRLETLATEVNTLAASLNAGMIAPAGLWSDANAGKLATLLGAASGGTIVAGTKDAVEIIKELKAKVATVKTLLTDKRPDIGDPTLLALKNVLSTASGAADANAAHAFLLAHCDVIDAQLTTLGSGIEDRIRGLFTIQPVTGSKNRTFVLQISANELKNNLDLQNAFTGVSVAVHTEHMKENDRVVVLFDNLDAAKPSGVAINGGDIFFGKLTKPLSLIFAHKHEGKSIPLGGFVDFATLSGTPPKPENDPAFNYINLTLAQSGQTPVDKDGNPTVYTHTFQKKIRVNSLEVGAKDGKLAFPHMQGNTLATESPFATGASANFAQGLEAKTKITLHKGSFVKSTDMAAVELIDEGSRISADNLKITTTATVLGDATWQAKQLTIGNLAIKGSALDLDVGSVLTSEPKSTSWSITDGEMNIKQDLVLPVQIVGDTAYFPIIEISSAEPQKGNFSVVSIADGKKFSLPAITKDKVNGEGNLSHIISVKKDALLQLCGGKEKAATIEMQDNKGVNIVYTNPGAVVEVTGKFVFNQGKLDVGADRGQSFYYNTDAKVIFSGNLVLKGNMKVEGTTLVFNPESFTDPCLVWSDGGVVDNKQIGNVVLSSNGLLKTYGKEKLTEMIKNGEGLAFISVKDNAKSAQIFESLSNIKMQDNDFLKIDTEKLKEAFKKAVAEGGEVKLPADIISINSDYKDPTTTEDGPTTKEPTEEPPPSDVVSGIWSRTSPGLRNAINSELNVAGDERSILGGALGNLALDVKIDNQAKEKALGLLSKGTSEEKARMTLQIIESARNVLYSKLNGDPGTPYRSLWASAFGDVARNDISGYKMSCDIYGFIAGGDARINDTWTVGILGGHGKAKGKYKGDWFMSNSNNRCDDKSYFGGVYTMWDDFITDLNVKVSLLGGHCKYDESRGYLDFNNYGESFQSENFHKGFFVSGDIDATYKHWSACGMDFGPWLALSITNVHHRAFDSVIGDINEAGGNEENEENEGNEGGNGNHHDVTKAIGSANRRAIDTIFGIAASYDLTSYGALAFNLGYKHDFRRLKGGNVELSADGEENPDEDMIKYDLLNGKSGRDSFVAKASVNMQFGQFGLSLGGHGQIGNHFKDIAGSITASYSF
jgi:hypothetical protein